MKIKQKAFLFLLSTLLFIVLIRCAASEMSEMEDIDRFGKDFGSNLGDTPEYQYDSGYQYDYGNIRDTGYIEPEKTNPYASVPPITSDKYLFILNQANNSITVIEPETLKVFSIKMDFSPKNLIVIPHTEYAIVLAENASKISMISIKDGKTELFSFQLGQQYNDISVSPDGKYIIAFYNERLRVNNQIFSGEGRINLIKTEDLYKIKDNPAEKIYREIDMGRRITDVFYSPSKDRAYIVSKERIYILRFDDPFNEKGEKEFINIDEPFTENIKDRITYSVQDSDYIVIRHKLGQSFLIVSTTDLKTYKLDFEGIITDVKFTKSMDKIIVSFRDLGKIKIIPLPNGINDNSKIIDIDLGNFLAGSIEICENQSFKKAILYTNAYYREELLIFNLDDYTFEKIDHRYELDKAINYILCSPDGLNAIIIHQKGVDPNENDPIEIAVNNQEGFSVMGLIKKKINMQLLLTSQVKSVNFLDDSSYAMVTSSNPTINENKAYIIDLSKPIINDSNIQFFSDIVFTGSLPNKRIFYILQKHPVGRISFVFMPEGTMKTITGFELNSLIE